MKLRAGIIGLGVGEAHIAGYESHAGCEVVALCDFSNEKITAAKKKYPHLRVTKHAHEILKDPQIDVVSIASHDHYHYEQIVEAVGHDKHIFVEKPLCLYEKEAIEIRKRLNEKPHLKLSSNLILRKCPRFNLLKKKIQDGEMGALFHVEGDYNYGRFQKIAKGWRGKIDFYSVIYGGGVHIVDLLLWLTKDRITEVAAYGNKIASNETPFKYNDSVTAILKFEKGATGKISVHFGCIMPHFHNLVVYGAKATFVNGSESGLLYQSSDPEAEAKKINEPYPGVHKGDLIYDFVEAVINDSESEVSKDDVFDAMSVCFAIEKASQSGNPVSVNYI